VDAARLSGARLRVFAHNDLNELTDILRWADRRHAAIPPDAGASPRTLIVTESVFSMDGDQAPLRELVELKDRFGAWLLVDEAHAVGLYGANRRGRAEEAGVADRIEVQMGTLGKALGSAGGYLCGAAELVELLVNRARPFIFSTAPVPAAAAAARAAIGVVTAPEGAELVTRLWRRVDGVRGLTQSAGWRPPRGLSAILPLPVGAEMTAVSLAVRLQEAGLLIPAVRFPAVARGAARLRLTVSAAHSESDLAALGAALAALPPEYRQRAPHGAG
jgi:7-keto-8-aminopelargonate synthetase-like enzyme